MLSDLTKVCTEQMTVREFATKYHTGINKTRRAKQAWLDARKADKRVSEDEINLILYPPPPDGE